MLLPAYALCPRLGLPVLLPLCRRMGLVVIVSAMPTYRTYLTYLRNNQASIMHSDVAVAAAAATVRSRYSYNPLMTTGPSRIRVAVPIHALSHRTQLPLHLP